MKFNMKFNMNFKKVGSAALAAFFVIFTLTGHTAFAAATISATATQTLETLTVDQAVQAAITASNDLKKMDDTATANDEKLENLKDEFRVAYEFTELISLSTQIMQLEASQSSNSQNKKVSQDKLRISIMNFFASVISAQNNLAIYDKSLAIQKKQLDIAKVKKQLGMISKVDYDKQTNSYEQKKASRQTQSIAIDNAFISLNKTMGASLGNKYNLMLNLQYEPLGEISLTAAIATAVATNPDVTTQQSNIDVAEYKLEHYDPFTDTTTTEDALKTDLNQADRTLYETGRSVEQKVTTAYNSILTQEVTYSKTKLELEALMIQLPVKEKQLVLGKITQLELDEFTYEIAQQQETLRSTVINHEINVLSFKNPATL